MNRLVFLFVFLVSAGFVFQQNKAAVKDDYLLLKCKKDGSTCAYLDRKGKIVIPYGKYFMCFTDTFRKIAFVGSFKDSAFIAINRKQEKLFKVFVFDNGPDYLSEGLFRFVDNDKIGFANMDGEIIIPAQHKFAWPFSDSLSAFNDSCVFVADKETGEYQSPQGGHWGFMNKKGVVVIPAKYDWADPFENGKANVKLNGKDITINKQGKIISK